MTEQAPANRYVEVGHSPLGTRAFGASQRPRRLPDVSAFVGDGDIDLERAIYDPEYRRKVIERLNQGRSESPEPKTRPNAEPKRSPAGEPPRGKAKRT